MPLRWTAVLFAASVLLPSAAHAQAPLVQGFEDGAPGWSATGQWHVQADPETVSVVPAIRDELVTLADGGSLPAAVAGSHVAWFGQAITGTYCGDDFESVKQTPSDGCTSTAAQSGTLTSPSFSLAGRGSAYLAFRAWWEIEAVQADVADLMRVDVSGDGGTTWQPAGMLNPLEPAWGGKHQPFTDDGPRSSASWQAYAVDLSAVAGSADVRVRFVFDTVDRLRNGFRGLLVDGVAVVDALGATITDDAAGPFTDAPPALKVDSPGLRQDGAGDWHVQFNVALSYPANHPVGVDWTVHGHSGGVSGAGHVVIAAGQTEVPVDVPVDGADGPYTVELADPVGGVVDPLGGSQSTPGGALPLVGIDSVGVSPDGTLGIGIGLSAPAATPVSVGYRVTGSDGVQSAAGTLTIPAGSVTASATLKVGAEHAPFTISLFNAVGALLDPLGTTATTSPLAVASVATLATLPGEQLVLGVREAGGGQPTLDNTFVLTVVSGTIRYHRPGEPYTTLSSGSITLPLGSVVDATNGHALITVDIDGDGTLQQVEVWEGKFGVFQVGKPAVAELRLAGGDYSVCAGSARKRAHRSGGTKTVRQLWASGKGRFRTKGRFASGTVRGTRWLTEDLCLATRVTVAEGIVAVRDFRRRKTTLVKAGDKLTVGALQSARFKKRRGSHPPKLSSLGSG
jgi:hypothetical protein